MVRAQESPRKGLPRWLSWPVVVSAPLVLVLVVAEAASSPWAIGLALVPLVIVGPALLWLDRVHPQRWSTRVHALLWGATVAALGGALGNTIGDAALGAIVSGVVVAPVVEETMKGLGVVWAVRRGEVDGALDGIVTAGWIGLGFAVTEDAIYFATTDQEGTLLQEFLLRGLVSPFAHPMLTFWTGLAIGIAVYRRRSLAWAWWGFALAVSGHVALNGIFDLSDEAFPPLGLALLVLLLVAAVIVAVRVRQQDIHRLTEGAAAAGNRLGISTQEAGVFASWSGMFAKRRQLDRDQRRRFDVERRVIARLALQQARPGGPDPERVQELVDEFTRSDGQ